MNFFVFSAIVNFITSSILGAFVISKDRSQKNVGFFMFCFSVAFWSLFYYLWQISDNTNDALLWTKCLMAAAAFIPISYLYFVYAVTDALKENKRFLILSYILFAILFLSVFTPYFISHVEPIMGFQFWPIAGPIYSIFLAIWFFYVAYSTYLLLIKYKGSSGITRLQIKYILIGMIIGFAGGSTNYFLWYRIPVLPVGNILVSVYVAMVAYAIIRYRFMDIRIVARRIFIYLGVAAFAYAIFYFLVWAYDKYFGGVFTTVSYVAGLVIAPLFVLSFYGLEKGLSRFSNKYLFASLYNYQTAINKLIDEVNYHIDLDKVVHLIAKTIQEAMKIKGVSVTLIDLAANNAIIKTINIDKANVLPSANGAVVGFLNKRPKPIVIEELEIAYEKEESPKLKNDLKALISEMKNCQKCSLILPLVSNKRVVGVILLGKRQGGDPYTHEDLDFLEILSKQAGIAVENAILYKKTNQFNDTLKQKVNEQTADLKKQNIHLEKLLQMRTEFLDIASHQLKTPVSVIRGTASMFMEGSMDKVSEAERKKFFKNIYDKATKLNVITSDILRASELDTDEFKIDPKLAQPAQVKEVLQSVYDDLKELADEKKIGLELSLPKKNPPELLTSPDFFEQAIYNLVDNAIKYTKTGAVKMSLEQIGNDLIIKVNDSGIGIPKKDQKKMFDKFSRASNAINMYADGSGLGLFIVKKIIEAHQGGKITFASEEGKGTTFTVVLGVK